MQESNKNPSKHKNNENKQSRNADALRIIESFRDGFEQDIFDILYFPELGIML